jgi:hypothetical protein
VCVCLHELLQKSKNWKEIIKWEQVDNLYLKFMTSEVVAILDFVQILEYLHTHNEIIWEMGPKSKDSIHLRSIYTLHPDSGGNLYNILSMPAFQLFR